MNKVGFETNGAPHSSQIIEYTQTHTSLCIIIVALCSTCRHLDMAITIILLPSAVCIITRYGSTLYIGIA